MADNSFNEVVNSMMQGMESFLSSKTVVGEPTQAGDTTIIPLVDVTFGVGAGASSQESELTGLEGTTTRLLIKNGQVRLVNIKNQDTVNKIIDMVPDLIDRFTSRNEDMPSDDEVVSTAFPEDK